VFNSKGTSCNITFAESKGQSRGGAPEGVVLDNVWILRRLRRYLRGLQPGDTVLQRTPGQARAALGALATAAELGDLNVAWYSLRRGGATHAFQEKGLFDPVLLTGRWQHQRTARIYINTALAELGAARLSASTAALVNSLAAECMW
jgi:hypothetical protein